MKKKIPISDFKAKCLSILDNLEPEGLDITKHGEIIATVMPVEQQSMSLIGCLKGKIKKKGKLFSTEVKWNAES